MMVVVHWRGTGIGRCVEGVWTTIDKWHLHLSHAIHVRREERDPMVVTRRALRGPTYASTRISRPTGRGGAPPSGGCEDMTALLLYDVDRFLLVAPIDDDEGKQEPHQMICYTTTGAKSHA